MGRNIHNNINITFLIYRSRSGSTLYADRLGRHPEVLVTPESKVGSNIIKFYTESANNESSVVYSKLLDYLYKEKKFRDWDIERNLLLKALKSQTSNDWITTLKTTCKIYQEREKPEAKVIVLKKSDYLKYLELLLNNIDESTILGIIRDPRAVYNSARKAIHSERGHKLGRGSIRNSLKWRHYVKRIKKVEGKWPDRILNVKYENLLIEMTQVLSKAWKFLGVRELSNQELNDIIEPKTSSKLITENTKHLHSNVEKKPIVERAVKWEEELPVRHKKIITFICKKYLKEYNYT